MAADVLLYKAELVPVGIDQEPHLEVMREIARKFNSMFGQTFPEPQRFKTEGEYVPSLTGEGKMSKSVEGSYVNLTDDLETIGKKFAKMPTAGGRGGGELPKEGSVADLFNMFKFFGSDAKYAYERFAKDYKDGAVSYETVKQSLSGFIYQELKPIQEKEKSFCKERTC